MKLSGPDLRLSDFDYDLPRELIAQYPLKERDACRLLVLDRARGGITHASFKALVGFLNPGDLLVVNDTRVLPCRLNGRRATGGAVEALLLRHRGGREFEAMLKPGRLKQGERVTFGALSAVITDKSGIAFETDDVGRVYVAGSMPLPPYIKRAAEPADESDYQTVYARADGAVAAPTAGLHFTQRIFEELSRRGVQRADLTLHVGPGTFRPVKTDDVCRHTMEPERYCVPAGTRARITQTKERGGRVVAVGTTTVRALESVAAGCAAAGTSEGETALFIMPGYRFQSVDVLLTNFHLPKTTLFMLVCAFAGTEFVKQAYQEAVRERYRFYSYGDAMLII